MSTVDADNNKSHFEEDETDRYREKQRERERRVKEGDSIILNESAKIERPSSSRTKLTQTKRWRNEYFLERRRARNIDNSE